MIGDAPIAAGHLIACRLDRLTPYGFQSFDDDDFEPAASGPKSPPYSMVGDIAYMDLVGYLRKYELWASMLTTSYRTMRAALRGAVADPAVRGILIRVDSPGGDAYGAHDVAMEIAAAAAKKPVVAWVDDISLSAAYYLSTGATRIVSNAGGWIGSIGTIAVVPDFSKMLEDAGIKLTAVRSAPRKAPVVLGTPVDEAAIAEVQREVDALGNQFKAWVIGRRGLNEEQQAAALDGRMFSADEAARLGLVDAIGNDRAAMQLLEELIMSDKPKPQAEADNPPAEPETEETAVEEEESAQPESQPAEESAPESAAAPVPAATPAPARQPIKPIRPSPPAPATQSAELTDPDDADDDEALRAKYNCSPALKQEFGRFEYYRAYVRSRNPATFLRRR